MISGMVWLIVRNPLMSFCLIDFVNLVPMEFNFKQLLHKVNCLVFDVDGVLTDGSLLITAEGEMLRSMNIRDGYAMQLAVRKSYHVFIISGSYSEGVWIRLNRLGVKEVHMNVKNKADCLNVLLEKYNLKHTSVLYMGDDMPDIEILKQCTVKTCPADAIADIKKECNYVSELKGGEGCVRDVIEQVMRLHGKWE